MLLGSGELGKEVAIAAQRLGCRVIAVDRYAGAPAMAVAHAVEVISMTDPEALKAVVRRHRPDLVIPEIEALAVDALVELEAEGITVIPTARATAITMNRDRIRDLAAAELGLRTARYAYADSAASLAAAAAPLGWPVVVKPVMSSSGKGQSVVHGPDEVALAWAAAQAGARGSGTRVIVEEFLRFSLEITLLTVRQWDGPTQLATGRHGSSPAASRPGDGPPSDGPPGWGWPVWGGVLSLWTPRIGRSGVLRAFAPAPRHGIGHPHRPEPERIRAARQGGAGSTDSRHPLPGARSQPGGAGQRKPRPGQLQRCS